MGQIIGAHLEGVFYEGLCCLTSMRTPVLSSYGFASNEYLLSNSVVYLSRQQPNKDILHEGDYV